MPADYPQLAPGQVVARRLREARLSAGLTQEQLSRRLADDVGYRLSRVAIAEIEAGRRRVTVDDWLALAAALNVAPVHLVVPFESERLLDKRYGYFEPAAMLRVGERLVMLPQEARSWIRGLVHHLSSHPDTYDRFYRVETPPPQRYRLAQLAERVLRRKLSSDQWIAETLQLDDVPQMYVPGAKDGFPAPLWAYLIPILSKPRSRRQR
jgi:transcriptional regulator with XRE-family HTH domain